MPVYDRAEQAALLNQDLFGEHDAIVHYLQHAWALQDSYGGAIESIARDEMRHLKWLAHTIIRLGGVPDLAVPVMRPAATGEALLESDVRAEETAIAQYQDHQRVIRNPEVEGLLGRIVVDEQDHRRRFAEMLEHYEPPASGPLAAEGVAAPVDAASRRLEALVRIEYQAVLQALWRSFLDRHLGSLVHDWEERAIDEMKHLGWMGEALLARGRWASFPEGPPALNGMAETEDRALRLYDELINWARHGAPDWLPLLDRIREREQYLRQTGDLHADGYTVGSLAAPNAVGR